VNKNFALYILSLLAGKLEKICTAFPLATFFHKKLKGGHLEFFPPKIRNKHHLEPKLTETFVANHSSFPTKTLNPENIFFSVQDGVNCG